MCLKQPKISANVSATELSFENEKSGFMFVNSSSPYNMLILKKGFIQEPIDELRMLYRLIAIYSSRVFGEKSIVLIKMNINYRK